MKPNVIDNLNGTVTQKPIELTHCLQHANNESERFILFRSKYNNNYGPGSSLTRVGQIDQAGEVYDVIVLTRAGGPDDGERALFLGHWNDGVA